MELGSPQTPQFIGFSPTTPGVVTDPKWIKARVIVRQLHDDDDDQEWPEYFLAVPRKGEQVRTARGRTLTILEVVYTITDDKPALHIEIGVSNEATPTSGGGEQSIEIG